MTVPSQPGEISTVFSPPTGYSAGWLVKSRLRLERCGNPLQCSEQDDSRFLLHCLKRLLENFVVEFMAFTCFLPLPDHARRGR